MSEADRLKRLHMRSMRRGTKEMDLVLGGYARDQLAGMDAAGLDLYEALLAENDHDLYQWVSGQGTAPQAYQALIGDIVAHIKAQHAT